MDTTSAPTTGRSPIGTSAVDNPNEPIPTAAVDNATLDRFITAYENHSMWSVFDPAVGSIDTWRDRVATYLVVGTITDARVETLPYFPAQVVPCSSSEPTKECTLPAFDSVLLVVDLAPQRAPYFSPKASGRACKRPMAS